MSYTSYWLSLVWIFVLTPFWASAQLFLQLEKYNDPKTIKMTVGDVVTYKVKVFPDTWEVQTIERLLVEDEVIIFEDGTMVSMHDIIEVRTYRKWTRALGVQLMRFGGTWLLFGGIIHLTDDNFSFGWDTLGIGGGAVLTGWILKTFLHKRNHKIGKKWRLRMLDLRLPTDPYGQSSVSG